MAFVDWNEEYTVHNQELDELHQRLFGIVNDLHAAILARHGKEEIRSTIDRLVEHTHSQFILEERHMQACAYSLYQTHKEEHEKLLRKVGELDREFRQNQSNIAPDMLVFLVKEWLVGHVLSMDKDYAASLPAHRSTRRVTRHP